MREYKREKGVVETQLADLEKRSQHHDDHLRIIDAWFDQVSIKLEFGWDDANYFVACR